MAILLIIRLFIGSVQLGAFLTAAYIIPALLSVKAVLHHDTKSYLQWTCYWLIFYLLRPLLQRNVVHPWIQILFLVWLSLKGGAIILYGAVISPLAHRYDAQIDQIIDWFYGKFKRAMFTFLAGSGVSLFTNFLLAIKTVTVEHAAPRYSLLSNDHEDEHHHAQMSLSPYVVDFLLMLSKGIYVFYAATEENQGYSRKLNQLRIFSYSERRHAFTLLSVEHHEGVIRDTLYLSQVCQIRAGVDCEEACRIQIVIKGQPQRVVELLLACPEDRDTMLSGLQLSLPYLKQHRFCPAIYNHDHIHQEATFKPSSSIAMDQPMPTKPNQTRSTKRRRNRASY